MKIIILIWLVIFIGFNLQATESFGGWIVGWGSNAAGQATGVSPYNFSTNETDVSTQMQNPKISPCSTGTVTVTSQLLSNITAISALDYRPFALKSDGHIVSWGLEGWGTNRGAEFAPPVDLTNVTAISAGEMHNLVLKQDGTVVVWGERRYGALDMPESLSNVVAITIACGPNSLALKRDGAVVGWGQSVKVPAGLSNVVAIAADPSMHMGINHPGRALALKRDGTVVEFDWSIGDVHSHIVEGLSNVVAIAAGPTHNLALKKDGTVYGWGFNRHGEVNPPFGLSNVVAIAASGSSFPANGYSLALRSDGTVVSWGGFFPKGYGLTVPEGLSNVVAISAGPNYCLAITTNRAVAERFRQK